MMAAVYLLGEFSLFSEVVNLAEADDFQIHRKHPVPQLVDLCHVLRFVGGGVFRFPPDVLLAAKIRDIINSIVSSESPIFALVTKD